MGERMNNLVKKPSALRGLFEPDEEDDGPNIGGYKNVRLTDNNDEVGVQEFYDEESGNFSDDDLPNPHGGGDVGSFIMEDFGPVNDHDHNKEGDSYEDLVAKRVAEFVQKSQDFLKSSELTMRVAKWHDMIGPRLDKVEQRKAFDVHAYGTHVLNSFNDTLGKNSENNPVDFVDVVSGKRAEEVARYFLSTLMLANTENVKIGTKVGTDPMLGMDNVQLTLLSRTRHHEQLAEFEAASQADPADVVEQINQQVDAEHGATEDGPHKAKKRSKKTTEQTNDLEYADESESEDDQFKIPKPPIRKKGKNK